jgi:hypothetical protein
MRTAAIRLGLGLSLTLVAALGFARAQDAAGDASPAPSQDPRVLLRYATFDPLAALPEIPPALRAGADVDMWIVQFRSTPTDKDRALVRDAGGTIQGYLPNDCHLVRMNAAMAGIVGTLPPVRWVGAYEPAYRLEAFLLAEHVSGAAVPVRRYNMVMADKRRDKQALEAKVVAIGGKVVDRHLQGLLFTAEFTGAQLIAAARFNEVLWIDRWSAPEVDMNNARIQGGANFVETAAGYTGSGVRGHIYEGCEFDHPDFSPPITNVLSGGEPQRHGHCTTGIVFGRGTNNPLARGMAPDAVGFYTNYTSVTPGYSRNMVINDVVNVHQCMFTTASWGSAQTPLYTADAADADDIVFDHRIPWTQSMSNLGNQNARPQAWAKNVISVGGVEHFDNPNPADDSWLAGGASIGPAQDGRNKPDFAAYYDSVLTSDLSSGVPNNDPAAPGTTGGYNNVADPAGQYFTSFNGTSSATPIVAGHNAIAIQMYTDSIFSNPPRVVGGTRFQNRPYAQTLKALMITAANLYTPTATDNRREFVGWGFPNLANMWNRRDRFMIIPEDVPITQGATHTYQVRVLSGETTLKVCMTYLDPAGIPAAAIERVNDLTLRVTSPTGTQYWGNHGLVGAAQTNVSTTGGAADSIDTVECVFVNSPTAGIWNVQITAPIVTTDAYLATPAVDATYALVVNGGTRVIDSGCARYIPDTSPTSGSQNYFPWGGYPFSNLDTTFANNNGLTGNNTVFFDVTVTNALYVTQLNLGTSLAIGDTLLCDVWRTNAGVSFVGNEANPVWLPMTAGRGTSAGIGAQTPVELSEPFLLTPGVYGFAIQYQDPVYTNGTGANQNYNNADVAIACGSSKPGAPGAAGGVFTPRVANMSFKYRRDGVLGTNIRYQTLIRRDELGTAGLIHGLSFSGSSGGRHWNDSLVVRMSHVPAGYVLVPTFATNLPTPVAVLNGDNFSWGIADGDWRELGLQTPFNYNGTSDLVIDVIARGNVQWETGAFQTSNEDRVYNAVWSGATPLTGTVASDSALRMRVLYNCSAANEHGSTCGRLTASHTGDGHRPSTFHFRLLDGPTNLFAVISLGLTNAAPLPLSLNSFGWTNCIGWNDPVVLPTVTTDASGIGDYPLVIPNNSTLDGAYVFGQWFTLDTSEPGGLTFSNHTRVMVGLAP